MFLQFLSFRLAAASALALLLSSASAEAAIAFVQNVGTNSTKATGTNISVTVPASGVPAGHFLVVAVTVRANVTVSCSDSQSPLNVYTVNATQNNGSTITTSVCTAYISAALVSGNTITATYSASVGSGQAISVNEFSGLPSSCGFDKYRTGTGSSTTPSSGSTRSTAQGNELLIGATGDAGSTNDVYTPGAGFTVMGAAGTSGGSGNIFLNPQYQIVSSAAAYTSSGTLSTSRTWSAAITTYRDANVPQAGATHSLSIGAPNNDSVSVLDNATLKPANITVEAWIKPSTFAANQFNVIAMKTSATTWTDGYGMHIQTDAGANGTLVFWINQYNGAPGATASAAITAGNWVHVAGTYDGANVNLYVNGNLVATTAFTTAINYLGTPALNFGNNAGGNPFNGQIDEMRLWSIARTQAEIQTNMHVTNLATSTNLKGYWMFDDAGCGTTAADSSGNANNGTLAAADQGAWNTSTAPLGPTPNGAFDAVTTATSVGPTGGTITATITTVPDNANNLGLYQFGSVTGSALSAGESFPVGYVSRSNIVWGVVSRGTVTGNLVFSYNGVPGIDDASTLVLLTRADANTMTWTQVTLSSRDDVNRTMTLNGQTQANFPAEYALGFQTAPTAVRLVSFTATRYDQGVLLEWQTGYEIDNLGFYVYRDVNGQRTRVTSSVIAGSGLLAGRGTAVTSVHAYAWWDRDAAALSGSASYWLQDLDFNGTSTWHGPVTPVAGGQLVPVLPASTVLPGLGVTTGSSSDKMPVTRGEPLGRRWGPGEGLKQVRAADHHDAGPLTIHDTQLATQWAVAARSAVKIGVRTAGWYRVSQPELVAAGLDPHVDPRTLSLFVEGIEQAMIVTRDAHGQFGPGSAIEFYGTGVDTPYTATRVYWLVAGTRAGRRISIDRLPATTGPQGTSSSFWMTRQRKDRSIYFAALENGDAENWFGPLVSDQPTDLGVELENIAPAAPSAAELEVTLQGVTMQGHRVGVLLNGTEVGEVTFAGREQGVAALAVPQPLLVAGTNNVRLVARGGDADFSLFDLLHLSYWHTYRADADRLWCTVEGQQTVSLGGFASPKIRVMDVTDPAAIAQVRTTVVAESSGSWAVRLRVPGIGSRRLLAFTDGTIGAPAFLRPHRPSRWHEASHAADYVVIAHQTFVDAVGALTALRAREGHTVAVVDVENVYDEFSFGEKTPQAIKDFLRRAKTTWRQAPQFVVLVGDATIDPRDYAGMGDADFVPTKLVPMDQVSLKTASDDWFVDLRDSGLPDLAIGRLSVRTKAQAQTMVGKIVSYQATGDQAWTKNVLLVADENDSSSNFEAASASLRGYLPPAYRSQDVFRGSLGLDRARRALVDAVNRGELLVNYNGHGSVRIWGGDGELLTNEDVYGLWQNGGRLPVVVAMNCLNGFFQGIWDEESLAEALMRAPQGGAVAVWASSSLTTPAPQERVDQELFRLIFQGGYATLGEAVAAAKRVVTDKDLQRSLIFFGDPALHMIGVPQPSRAPAARPTALANALVPSAHAQSTDHQLRAQDTAAAAEMAAAAEATAVRLADLTGEGRATALVYAPQSGRWALENGTGVGGARAGLWKAHEQVMPAHLVGRSRADLVFYDPDTGVWEQALNTGAAMVRTARGVGAPGGHLYVGDFTGAGHDDVLTYAPATGTWTLGVTDGAGGIRTVWHGTWPVGARLHVADVTGDGQADVVGYDTITGHGFLALNLGAGRFSVSEGAWGPGWQVAVANLDGDARADLFFYHRASGTWIEGFSDGRGSFMAWRGTWASDLVVQATDLDGDGRDDVVGYNPTTGEWLVAMNRGAGVFATESGLWTPGLTVATGDLKGDGRGGIVLYEPGSGAAFELSLPTPGGPGSPGGFDVRAHTWMTGGVLVGQPR